MAVKDFDQFFLIYLKEHSLESTRQWHFLGTTIAVTLFFVGLLTGKFFLWLLALVAGYGLGFLSHHLFEKNQPLTFKRPLWSFLSDFKMIGLMLQGKLDVELQRAADLKLSKEDI